MEKKTAGIIGIVLGIAVIIVGFCVQGISIERYATTIGSDIKFGADFYTEMYDVTREVGYAINDAKNTVRDGVEGICDAIGWLIMAIGLLDVAYFTYKMASDEEKENMGAVTKLPPSEDIFAKMKAKNSTEQVKRCPYCGDIVKLGRCEMCGKEVK